MSHPSREKEHQKLLERTLMDHGVHQWTTRRTRDHVVIEWVHNGKPGRFLFSGTKDPMARLRNRSILRRILRESA